MRKISYVLLAAILFSACSQPFKRGEKGLEYKIISKGSGQKLKSGDFMQIHLGQYYDNGKKDSLLNDSRTTTGPLTELLDSITTPPEYFKIINQLKKGDSLVIRTLTDSVFAKFPDQMPPYMAKGHYLITTIQVVNVFTNRTQADSARTAEMGLRKVRDSIAAIAIMTKDDKTIADYLAKNNIKAQKAAKGTYVEIIQPGSGPLIDTGVVVKVNYTGKTMAGKQFDSNTDPSKPGAAPLTVNMTNDYTLGQSVIKGWTDGLTLLNKGAKAKFYIPSPLAYGPIKRSEEITPNSILFFDIEVVDVIPREVAKAEQQKKMEETRSQRLQLRDSIAKMKLDTTGIRKGK